MTTETTRLLLQYLVGRLGEREVGFGKTKLVKLLYLTDIESVRIQRRPATDLEWQFYHYGPYPLGFDVLLREVEIDLPEETAKIGRSARVVKSYRSLTSVDDLARRLDGRVRACADKTLDRWAFADLNVLLDYVYFHTAPMKDVKRG